MYTVLQEGFHANKCHGELMMTGTYSLLEVHPCMVDWGQEWHQQACWVEIHVIEEKRRIPAFRCSLTESSVIQHYTTTLEWGVIRQLSSESLLRQVWKNVGR
jgi:hypothetical protein